MIEKFMSFLLWLSYFKIFPLNLWLVHLLYQPGPQLRLLALSVSHLFLTDNAACYISFPWAWNCATLSCSKAVVILASPTWAALPLPLTELEVEGRFSLQTRRLHILLFLAKGLAIFHTYFSVCSHLVNFFRVPK